MYKKKLVLKKKKSLHSGNYEFCNFSNSSKTSLIFLCRKLKQCHFGGSPDPHM